MAMPLKKTSIKRVTFLCVSNWVNKKLIKLLLHVYLVSELVEIAKSNSVGECVVPRREPRKHCIARSRLVYVIVSKHIDSGAARRLQCRPSNISKQKLEIPKKRKKIILDDKNICLG